MTNRGVLTPSSPVLDWRLWIALAALVVSMGWLDIVRGRELAIVNERQQMVIERLEEIRRRIEQLEQRHYQP